MKMRTLTEGEAMAARVARATYWAAIGELERAAAEPSPESLQAWFLSLAIGSEFLDVARSPTPVPQPPRLNP